MGAPKTAHEEFYQHVIKNANKWLDYRMFADLYYDLNAHKKLAKMKELGFIFEERNKEFTSRFGFDRTFKQFRLAMDKKEAIRLYNEKTKK